MHSEQQGDPPEAEWNFSRCPKSEAGICWLYEHLRGLKQFGTLESNNERYLGAVLIAPADGRTRFLRQCEALWNIVVPENRNLPKRKRGLGSPFARSPSDFRKLSAWRLHRVYRMSVDDAIAFLTAKVKDGTLKKGYYLDSKHFLRAVLECEISLKKYLR